MNKITMLSATLITALWMFHDASADELTIPNVFQPNQPARAVDVNANFEAVEASVDDNASAIVANEAAIQANSTAISGLSAGVGMPVYSNGNLVGHLVTIFGSSSAFMQSDMGYMFEAEITSTSYLVERTVYYSDTGCGGTAYVVLSGFEWAGNTTGIVVRAPRSGGPVPSDVHYVPRDSGGVDTTAESSFGNGVCKNETESIFGFEALPNDETITGVPSIRPGFKFYIGLP